MPQIRVSQEILNRLKACAEPFVDKEPEDVIRRLLDNYDKARPKNPVQQPPALQRERAAVSRIPRERGAVVEISGHQIRAVSVRDLYEQALRFLVDGHRVPLARLIPFRTSRERYLLADKPIHPSGNPFVVPVEYHGRYMEAHKDYTNAIEHLRSLVQKLGLDVKYLG